MELILTDMNEAQVVAGVDCLFNQLDTKHAYSNISVRLRYAKLRISRLNKIYRFS